MMPFGMQSGGNEIVSTYEKLQLAMHLASRYSELMRTVDKLSRDRNELSQADLYDKMRAIRENINTWLLEVWAISDKRPTRIQSFMMRRPKIRKGKPLYPQWRTKILYDLSSGLRSLDDADLLLTDIPGEPNLGQRFVEELEAWTIAEASREHYAVCEKSKEEGRGRFEEEVE